MKISTKVSFLFLFSIIGFQTAFAQSSTFTVLPGTDKNTDECNAILDQYQVSDGKIPSAGQIQNAQEYNDAAKKVDDDYSKVLDNQQKLDAAKNALQQAQESYQNADALCQGKADPQACKEELQANSNTALNVVNNAQTNFDQAQQLYNQDGNQANAIKQKDFPDAGDDFDPGNPATMSDVRANLLGCAIKTGRISLTMAPYFVTYIINFALGLVGLISLFFTVVGGYYYVFGGLSDDKDKGKNTIKNALIGMVIALLAWSAVNVIIQAITG